MTGTRFAGISNRLDKENKWDLGYIIRNASYFGPLDIVVPQVAFVQDILSGNLGAVQRRVREAATVRVFNSEYTKDRIGGMPDDPVIPISVDFDVFAPTKIGKDVLFIGANSEVKGVDRFLDLVNGTTDHLFHAVMKDGHKFNHPKIYSHGRVTHENLKVIMGECRVLVCTSREETQHLAGIEAAAMGLQIVAPPIGCYCGMASDKIGAVVIHGDFAAALDTVMMNPHFSPREYFKARFSRDVCKQRWVDLIRETTS